MVTICTTSLTFTNSTFCPHSVFKCFVRIWEQTAIISLYSINWLVFITETESVYCAVRTGYLTIFQMNSYYKAVRRIRQLVTDPSHRRYAFDPSANCEICSKQRIIVTGFSSSTSVLSLSVSSQPCSVVILILILLSSKTKSEETRENANKEYVARYRERWVGNYFRIVFRASGTYLSPK